MTEQIGILIKNLNNDLQRYASREAKKIGITQVQMNVIDFVYRNEKSRKLYQTDVEREFNIQKSSATALLQLMEKKQLIIRTPSRQDNRLKVITLTSKSQLVVNRIRTFFDQNDEQLKNFLGDQADQFTTSLQLLLAKMENLLDH
ncbi:MarR family winged helix-turn-helix transcriptional regulator [Levilactobacillus brevis]|uniref:MarR family winged helix-turn-helix transcriptional regulator n=1 Tax=Levilactobacillus brevis TaxID=1580 RepID=UPI001BDE7868|nr:MarR family transcriptional regulator [Levilactobacillus brevis]